MTTYKLSPSRLNLYQDCKTCFWSELNHGEKRPSGPFPSLPSGMDKILKQRFDTYRERGQLPEELSSLKDVSLYKDEKILKEWRNQRRGLQWTNPQGHSLTGSLDEALQTAAGEIVVLDYKTRGFPLKATPDYYTLQMECYTWLLQKNGFKTADHAFLLFYYPDQFNEQGEVKFHNQLIKVKVETNHAENIFSDALALLKAEKPRLNKDCNYCLYKTPRRKPKK